MKSLGERNWVRMSTHGKKAFLSNHGLDKKMAGAAWANLHADVRMKFEANPIVKVDIVEAGIEKNKRVPIITITKQKWLDLCAAQFVQRAGLTVADSIEQASLCADNQDGEVAAWASPEVAADEELSCWSE